MPIYLKTSTSPKQWGAPLAARLGLLMLLAALLAGPAAAKNPWESIAAMIRNKAADASSTATATSTTQTASLVRPAAAMPEMPAVGATPDDISITSGGQPRVLGSAALALLRMTTATAATNMNKFLAGNKAKDGPAIDVGRESDENETLMATDLFKREEIRRLLGDEPRFIYNPQNRPDPMVVPWVRRAAIFKELSVLAENYVAQMEFDKAVLVYQRILQMDDPRFNAAVHEKLQAIADKQNESARIALSQAAAPRAEEVVELPAWVHDNTTGVIVSQVPGDEMCLVGEFMLRAGDKVPSYPEVAVASISSKKVVYQIKSKTFEVLLNPN